MFPTQNPLPHRRLRSVFTALLLFPQWVSAQVFTGGGVSQGLDQARTGIAGLSNKPLRTVVTDIMINVLNYLSLAAVIVVVAAGIWLILGFGEDDAREKAKKMILYTLAGLAIVFLARLMIGFIRAILQ